MQVANTLRESGSLNVSIILLFSGVHHALNYDNQGAAIVSGRTLDS